MNQEYEASPPLYDSAYYPFVDETESSHDFLSPFHRSWRGWHYLVMFTAEPPNYK